MQTDMPVSLENVSYLYGKGALSSQILFDIDVTVKPGEIVILTGPSGSGKTTLLTLIGALRSAQAGSVKVLGQELKGAKERQRMRVRRNIGYIFQSHNLLRSLTVSENVRMAQKLAPGSRRDKQVQLRQVLDRVGLAEHVQKYPSALSGGQKQRAGIARALVNHPRVVLADEPTASLDRKAGRDVVDLIQDLAREDGAAVVLVTHDNRILDVADRILHLEDGHMKSNAEAVAEDTSRLLNLLGKHTPESSSYLAAFAFALARVAYADNVVLDSERDAVRRILRNRVGLGAGEVDLVMELSLMQHTSANHPERFRRGDGNNSERNRLFVESLYDIARADGEVVTEELEEIHRIADEFGISRQLPDAINEEA